MTTAPAPWPTSTPRAAWWPPAPWRHRAPAPSAAHSTTASTLPGPRPPPSAAPLNWKAPPAPAAPSIACAWFNTGELLLEPPGQPALRLSAQQSAELLRWLQRVQPTIPEEPTP